MRQYSAFDQTIEVEFRAFPAFFWLIAGFEVRVNGQVFHPQLDRAGFFGQPITEFYVLADGQLIPGMVRGVGHWFFLTRKRYSLVLGMSELARETQPMRGWLLSFLAAGAAWVVAGLAVLGICFVMLWARGWPVQF